MRIIVLLFAVIMALPSGAQPSPVTPPDDPSWYLRNFQEFLGERPDADSAHYCITRIASKPEWSQLLDMFLVDLLPMYLSEKPIDSLSGDLKVMEDKKFAEYEKLIILLEADTVAAIRERVMPMKLSHEVRRQAGNPAAVRQLVNTFINTQFTQPDVSRYKIGKYALAIIHDLDGRPEYSSLTDELSDRLLADLKKHQVPLTDTISRAMVDRRAWFRYSYALANYQLAVKAKTKTDRDRFYQQAYAYSPDLRDQNSKYQYGYDMIYILGEPNETFQDEYITYMRSTGAPVQQVLSLLTSTALVHPLYRDTLRQYYQAHPLKKESFDDYWYKQVSKSGRIAPVTALYRTDSTLFELAALKGQWVFVDFWGTWCGPCRFEHPELEAFYKDFIQKNEGKIAMMTIACRDTKEKVLDYMKEKNYSFPVAMSDGKIQNSFGITGYPGKVLVTPDGKFVSVPFGMDWKGFVQNYTGL